MCQIHSEFINGCQQFESKICLKPLRRQKLESNTIHKLIRMMLDIQGLTKQIKIFMRLILWTKLNRKSLYLFILLYSQNILHSFFTSYMWLNIKYILIDEIYHFK